MEQPDIALLDQVEQGQAAPQVPPCDADDEPKIGLDQLALGLDIAVLHAAGEGLLLLAGEEVDLGDLRHALIAVTSFKADGPESSSQ